MSGAAIAAVAIAVALGGCGDHARQPFGDRVGPPPPLDQLHPGMTIVEAGKLVPALGAPQERTLVLELPATAWGRLSVVTDSNSPRRVTEVEALVHDRQLGTTLAARWGAGRKDGAVTVWDSAETGWRAGLICDRDDCNVRFSAHGTN